MLSKLRNATRIPSGQRLFSTSSYGRFVPKKKIALCVGNDAYTSYSALSTCTKDATDIHNALLKIGFESELLVNVPTTELRKGLGRLAYKREQEDLCLFYFSGHGLEYCGRNYIFNTSEKTPVQDGVLLQTVLSGLCLQADAGTTVLISDACRTADGVRHPALTKEERQVITEISPAVSEFLFEFGTGPNDVALCGDQNENSIFTRYLIPLLGRADLDLASMFVEVRSKMRKDNCTQRSWTHHSLSKPIYLVDIKNDTANKE